MSSTNSIKKTITNPLLLNTNSDVEFILLEDEQDTNFEKYKDIFENSKIKEEHIKESYSKYSISVKDFDSLLYEYLSNYSTVKIPEEKLSIASYKNPNASFINDTIVFRNNIDIKDILDQLQITISLETNNLESELRIIKNIYKVIKLKCSVEYVHESKRIIIKYPIMFIDLETPMILAIYKEHNKIIGYINYRDVEHNSMFIEFIEVNPEYRNMNLCKRMLSFLIIQKPNIMNYELINVGGLSGYSCYVDAFESNDFKIKIKFDKKINITKLDNVEINSKFNGIMYFTKNK